MKILSRFFLIGWLFAYTACQKEAIDIPEESIELKFGFKTKTKTLKATDLGEKASLKRRYNHASLVFDDRMWILGGNLPSEKLPKESNDVAFSYDGAEWKHITEQSNFPYRTLFGATVFEDKMWMVGGFAKNDGPFTEHKNNDVWCSKNGIEWKMVTPDAGFQKRSRHTLTAFKGSLWVIGGGGYNKKTNVSETLSDIWRSTDGHNWVKVTDNAPFGPRASHAAIVHDGRLWVIGGQVLGLGSFYGNDVWYTENGVQWVQATDQADFPPRGLHTLTTDGKLMWLAAGYANEGTSYEHQNDIWHSSNGVKWYKAETSKKFPERAHHSSVFFNKKLWVINGAGPIESADHRFLSDVWSFE